MTAPIQSAADATSSTARDRTDAAVPPSALNATHGPSEDTGSLDLLHRVNGLYRFLDVVSEQGTGGVVDKIVIDEDGVKAFVNTLSPGAYKSVSSVDFAALDTHQLELVGIYGSKSEIASFFLANGYIDETTAFLLKQPHESQALAQGRASLRSGLYILASHPASTSAHGRRTYLIFWPEDTTWSSHASSSTKKSRVAFMRYLTKLTDQLLVFVSPEHANSITWKDAPVAKDDGSSFGGADDEDTDDDLFSSNRIYEFAVEKTAEQNEDIQMRPGFELHHLNLVAPKDTTDVDTSILTPRLVLGETSQALLTAVPLPARRAITKPFSERLNVLALKSNIEAAAVIRVGLDISDDGLEVLVANGLNQKLPDACRTWREVRTVARQVHSDARAIASAEIRVRLEEGRAELVALLRAKMLSQLVAIYPESLTADIVSQFPESTLPDAEASWLRWCGLYPGCPSILQNEFNAVQFDNISKVIGFKHQKCRLFAAVLILQKHDDLSIEQKETIIRKILKNGRKANIDSVIGGNWNVLRPVAIWPTEAQDELQAAITAGEQVSDLTFIVSLEEIAKETLFVELATASANQWKLILRDRMDTAVRIATQKIASEQLQILTKQAQTKRDSDLQEVLTIARLQFIQALEDIPVSAGPILTYFNIERVRGSTNYSSNYWYATPNTVSYFATGEYTSEIPPSTRFTLHPFSLSEDEKQALRLDPNHIPQPAILAQFQTSFSLPLGFSIRHIQLLDNNKCFLVVAAVDSLHIYIDSVSNIELAINHSRHKTKIHYERIGKDFVLSFDESKRAMAILAMFNGEYNLHIFECDEHWTSLRASHGSPVSLTAWFIENPRMIRHMSFVGGSDAHVTEMCLVDEANYVRIFSLITAQFLPATLTLRRAPVFIASSPDASCLFSIGLGENNSLMLEAYHWASFTSADVHELELASSTSPTPHCITVTSLVERNRVHIVLINVEHSTCRSYALDISKKMTEYALKAKGNARLAVGSSAMLSSNALIECLSDVWTRFPVVPAISRATITSGRAPPRITFVTERDHERYAPHFAESIQAFEQTTRKPTGGRLGAIKVEAISFNTVVADDLQQLPLSRFHAGEWLIEAMCLIPIQIAVTRENRFIPLKDGVWSANLERNLLGASVNMVANNISLGWYESIFSYPPYVHRPVKVVSSMGEQSVGKSYSVNHLVDTSFAGSAMRCTEGVWMSCTPTSDALVVSLDFEGVQSIERSAQEDTLLVLFNTAISNMILFRNNFALSRDIAGLFTSFQSASTILDPAINTSLFQSKLVIIIKDTIESDQCDMVKEFQLKFSRIVLEEQARNFISRAHRGQTSIIPWPVIESRQFYELFNQLRKMLAKQKISHPTADGFLLTLKTLMAKIKTHDWGALDRTHHNGSTFFSGNLLQLLSAALVHLHQTNSLFYFASPTFNLPDDPADHQAKLAVLRQAIQMPHPRQTLPDAQWVDLLSTQLRSTLGKRVQHVLDWVTINTARFSNNSETLKLRRILDSAIVDVQAGIEFCRAQCIECELLCLLPRRHEQAHECTTSHRCEFRCEIVDDHDDQEPCGLPAGHNGAHICNVLVHLCGEPCTGSGRPGCLAECSKSVGHDGGVHLCAGRHVCGSPCDLNNVSASDGSAFSCPGVCTLPWDDRHYKHACESRMCPLECSLCKRLCNGTHFHGQDKDAVHICDQEHACKSLCGANGVCDISTVPHAIESTFTGRHEVFQYTKYSQDARRLPCEVRIPPGEIAHAGAHTHTHDPTVVHFCDTRCPMCDYMCTLPYGHPQAEHETSHGSMLKTRWAIERTDDSALEIDGHKFAANDTGAPMLCGSVCEAQGRHVHLDYCRAANARTCIGNEIEHLSARIGPRADLPKDAVSHAVFWKRTGFKGASTCIGVFASLLAILAFFLDPYSRENKAEFARCDHACCGEEHKASPGNPARPSYCTQPIFHAPAQQSAQTTGYVSSDGHTFLCANPAVSNHAYHVFFVIDHSTSMRHGDRKPLANTPVYKDIRAVANNRLGAVYSALHGFWIARDAAIRASGPNAYRRDSYSVILFDANSKICLENDFNSTPRQLLDVLLRHERRGKGTNFGGALQTTQALMEKHWRSDLQPVVIFLSDGECRLDDQIVFTLCRRSLALGKPLALHSVSFGYDLQATSLRRMAEIGGQVHATAPQTAMGARIGATNQPQSSFSKALDSIKLTETFLDIAASMRKPRAALMRS